MPALPPPGEPVLIRVVTSSSRQQSRQELRIVLRQVLAAWSGFLPEQLVLNETASGPVWPGRLGGHGLDISLSYAEGEAWIGLIRDGAIGVDAMRIQIFPEAEIVARDYLGFEALKIIQASAAPALAFASAWTAFEARLKCLKQPLREQSAAGQPTSASSSNSKSSRQISHCADTTGIFVSAFVASHSAKTPASVG